MLCPGSPQRKLARVGELSMRAHPPGRRGAHRGDPLADRGRAAGPTASCRSPRSRPRAAVRRLRPGQRRRHGARGGGQLRRTPRVAGGDHRREALHRRRHALDGQRRPGPRRRRGRRDRPAAAGFSKATSIRRSSRATGADPHGVVDPRPAALVDIGKNVLDPAKRADAARTGLRQAADVVEKVRRPGSDSRR